MLDLDKSHEKKVLVVDQGYKERHEFDNTVSPPKSKQVVRTAAGAHAWICYGRHA